MRVICIDDKSQHGHPTIPRVKKGNVYTVLKIHKQKAATDEKYKYDAGDYYELIECGKGNGYHASIFQIINENEVDETEMERNYQKDLVS